MRLTAIFLACALPCIAAAQSAEDVIDDILDHHVLPGFAALATETEVLARTAAAECDPQSEALRSAYGSAFDAWVRVSHLRFGPAEAENRGFALAFWPDSRGATPRSLAELIRAEDPVIETGAGVASLSVAARGFYALEFLLYDAEFADPGPYGCALLAALSADIHATSRAILNDWQTRYAPLMRDAGNNETYQSAEEGLRRFFGAVNEGLEFTVNLRLGRPMGTFERPRPRRAEVRRSGRSLHHVVLSLEAQADLADRLAAPVPEVQTDLAEAFSLALTRAEGLDDPVFAGVEAPIGRIRVEALQLAVQDAHDVLRAELGPALGIAAGFNSLDGD